MFNTHTRSKIEVMWRKAIIASLTAISITLCQDNKNCDEIPTTSFAKAGPIDASLLELLLPKLNTNAPIRTLSTCPLDTTPKNVLEVKHDIISISKAITTHSNLHLLPGKESCGQSTPSLMNIRIAGGIDAGLGTFPWMVLIGYSLIGVGGRPGPTKFLCGGSLINENYVLTAAHCVSESEIPQGNIPISVRLGEYNQSSIIDCSGKVCAPPPQDISIAEIIVHQSFNRNNTKENDIALVRLANKAQLGRFVSPVCLPRGERIQNMTGMTLTVAGWGHTTARDPSPSQILQKVDVPFQNREKCNEVYHASLGRDVDDGRFCVGGEVGKDSCSGDSGGPLMIGKKVTRETEETYVTPVFQVGIVSLGPGDCNSSVYPGLYTNVFYFMEWLLDHLKE